MAEVQKNLDLFLGLLPFDVAVQCLARVPHACHGTSMARVCKSWRTIVNSPFFYDLRRQLGVAEPSAYTCVPSDAPEDGSMTWYGMDPQSKQWRRLPVMLEEHRPVVGFQTVTIEGSRLLVLGGSETKADGRLQATGKVSQYCPIENRWTVLKGEMSVPRTNFAIAVLQDRIYVRGGEQSEKQQSATATEDFDWSAGDAVMDVDVPDVLSSFEVKSFIGVLGQEVDEALLHKAGHSDNVPEQLSSSVEVYDPQTGMWTPVVYVEGDKSPITESALNDAFLAAGGFVTPMELQYN